MPLQFKLAESGGVPFAVILGEEEQAQSKVRIKEMGLPEGHPEKDGVPVNLSDLVPEVKKRLAAKAEAGEDEGQSLDIVMDGKGSDVKTIVDATEELDIDGKR